MSIYSIILDLIILAVSLCFICYSYKKGFVYSIINMLGYIAAIVCAIYLSRFLADFVFEHFIRDGILTTVTQQINNTLTGIVDGKITNKTDFSSIENSISKELPAFFSNLIDGFLANSQSELKNFIGKSTTETAVLITDKIIAPLIISFLKFSLCILIFMVSMFVIKLLLKLLNIINNIPVVSGINAFLGAIIGIFQAFI
ncbi:MAG: CvpA family protein, partial [Oscillospiraceae bacterium]